MASASQWIVLARILRPQGRKGEVLADRRVALEAPGFEHGNLVVLGDDLLGHDQFGKGLDFGRLGVDLDPQFPGRADGLFGRRQQ